MTQGPAGTVAVEADRVLVATGRWPNTDNLGLEECGLSRSGRFIAVDDRLATSLPGVWAIGDAVGGWMLAHKAMVEGRVVAENLTGGSRRVDHRAVPNVIFTRPEVAGVGLTESDARAAGAEVKVAQFPFSANPKARILGERDGVVRLVCEAGSGRVLGRPHARPTRHRPHRRRSPGRASRRHGRRTGMDHPCPSDPAGSDARGRARVPRGRHSHEFPMT